VAQWARVAFYVGLNVEHFEIDKPSTSIWSGTSHLKPDPLNHGWRDYGARVGIWRLIDTFDRFGMRASVLLNSDVLPALSAKSSKRDDGASGHGSRTARTIQFCMRI